MLRGIVTVGAWTMASRVLGFARDMLIAALLGDGPVADAFFVALRLPNLFRRLFGEGAFNAAFIPAFSGMLAAEGRPLAERFASAAFGAMTVGLGVLVLLGEIFMPWVVRLLAPGFAEDPSKFATTIILCRITFPYLVLICLTALVSGVLNGLDRYAAAAGSAMLFNVSTIAAMIWLTPYVATAGHALAWGLLFSGVAQLGLLLVALHRTGFALRPRGPLLTPQIRLLLRRMAPGLLGAGVTQLNVVIDGIIASLLPAGSVSLLYYADRVQQLPLGVIGAAVGTAMLPLLSRQVRAGEANAAADTANRAIEYALVLTLPAALALIVLRQPVIAVLFGRGAFNSVAEIERHRRRSRRLRGRSAGLRARAGAGTLLLRPHRYRHPGEGRRGRGGAQSGAQRRLHAAAATDGAAARDQSRRDLQRGAARRRAARARAPAARCAAAGAAAADGDRLGGHDGGAVGRAGHGVRGP